MEQNAQHIYHPKSRAFRIVALVLFGVVLAGAGALAGYSFGHLEGRAQGIVLVKPILTEPAYYTIGATEDEKAEEAQALQAANPFEETKANPFDQTVNPFEETTYNPFE